ncbi:MULTISPECIES: GNAT family N-acetyltransferase [Gordonia]|uniref:Spermidine N1-acetyltransferase n=1 Tax=Gordonia cholesterolivorans TaxID=559625 RepID=A0ABN3HTP2_9ACTN|nr:MULTISPECIES: GNAT family N-acetyltransferase [Gordonia]KXT56570.1 spermidine acetyltransferase [Gordonia sp. QH-12]WFN94274.1 GNAT family N-acetyltransferase [Gordonia sihwensis]
MGDATTPETFAAPRLRALERADLQFVHGLFNDPEVMRYWFEPAHVTITDLEETFVRQQRCGDRERRFIVDAAGRRVGLVELVYIDQVHRNCEFQIIIAPGEQGRGYAGAATRAALDFAFRSLNLHKVYLLVDTENAAAIHVYEKAGFVVEGVLRREFFADGAYRDATRMGIFQDDYLAAARS